ncbi:hypothetical protein [Flavobacterium sp. IMCC34518]|uniref:hypothetical protein n=1 Tax=Flavobacterium sp. IMCC34518 TaxID=3003623 RepID=UPI0024823F09|nr:hypothetical protein [Flavobacterium sp. IMCC34518]
MKIKLKLSSDELRVISEKVSLVNTINLQQLGKEKKSAYSILIDIVDKVVPKAQKLSRQLAIADKPHELTLKWHEAEALEQYLLHFEESDIFSSNLIRKVTNKLNQKLA